ncbi:MAG: universal stress protein [Pseudomonadota bacterium]|nr:universal stress protein [Pseudomonadota bacterium]
MTKYRKILVAVDLSPEAKPVLARARELREFYGADLCLIHVMEPLVTTSDYELSPDLPLEVERTIEQRAVKHLEALAGDMDITDALQTVEIGSVKREILNFAQEHDYDLIVIGTHGRHGVATLLGSTANSVLHGTTCDVMCVRVGD